MKIDHKLGYTLARQHYEKMLIRDKGISEPWRLLQTRASERKQVGAMELGRHLPWAFGQK